MAKIDLWELKELREQGNSPKELAAHFKCSEKAVYVAIKKLSRLTVPKSIEVLTEKQRKFIELKAAGFSGTEAALKSYDCQDRKSAREIASQNMARPEIQAAMSDWLEWCGCGRGRRAERLAEFVENPDPNVALPALREAMKAGADFPNSKVQVETEEIQYVISFTHNPEDSEPIAIGPSHEIKRITYDESGE